MKYFLTFIFTIIVNSLFAQNFNTGYKDGFEQGFCMDKVNNTGTYLGCVAPLVTPPYPRATESINNYLDGYNRGLVDGIKRKEKINISNDVNSGFYLPEYKPFNPDFGFYLNLMKIKSTNNSNNVQNKSNTKKLSDFDIYFKEYFKNYNSEENVELRRRYILLIEEIYKSYNKYPDKIPNGVYNVTLIHQNNKFHHIEENATVIVQDNKIIQSRYKYNWDVKGSYSEIYAKSYFPKHKFNTEYYVDLGINNNSNNITNGMVNYCNEVLSPNEFNNQKELKKSYTKIYFNDFIRDYNNCQEKLEKLKQNRATKNLNKKVLDGWQNAILTNNINFYYSRKVFVQNNKVIKWIGGQGDELKVDGGGEINFLNSTIIHNWPRVTDNVIWENTFLYKENKEVYDVYFE
jgi:hypothetical protein